MLACDIDGLETVGQIRRLIEIAVLDTLGLENSIARSRTLAYLAHVALKLLEVGEVEDRIGALERALASEADTPRISADGPTSRFTFVETQS